MTRRTSSQSLIPAVISIPVLAAALIWAAGAGSVKAQTPPPASGAPAATFYGTVFDSVRAVAGVTITARVDDANSRVCGSATSDTAGNYSLDVPNSPLCYAAGRAVTFRLSYQRLDVLAKTYQDGKETPATMPAAKGIKVRIDLRSASPLQAPPVAAAARLMPTVAPPRPTPPGTPIATLAPNAPLPSVPAALVQRGVQTALNAQFNHGSLQFSPNCVLENLGEQNPFGATCSMQVGDLKQVSIVITGDLQKTLATTVANEAGISESVSIALLDRMQVHLRAFPNDAFEVVQLSDDVPFTLGPDNKTAWYWQVVPKRAGRQALMVSVVVSGAKGEYPNNLVVAHVDVAGKPLVDRVFDAISANAGAAALFLVTGLASALITAGFGGFIGAKVSQWAAHSRRP